MATPSIIDELFWGRLSSYWTDHYNADDRAAVSRLYEGMFHVLDAEMVRLFQINDSKSLDTHPVYTQRRWLRLDLNRYAELRDWLRYVATHNVGSDSMRQASGDRSIACQPLSSHAKHWHISFSWAVQAPTVAGDVASRSIPLGYPTAPSLVELYWKGVRLLFNEPVGFLLSEDLKTIIVQGVPVGETLHCHVGLNLNGPEYAGFRPVVKLISALEPPNAMVVPDMFGSGFPIHAMIVSSPPPGTSAGFTATNDAVFNTRRQFVPWTNNPSTGVYAVSSTKIGLPLSAPIDSTERVLLFTLEPGEFNVVHDHQRVSKRVSPAGTSLTAITGFDLDVAVLPGVFGSTGFLGNEVKLFVNGLYVSPDAYRLSAVSSRVDFRDPVLLPTNKALTLDLFWDFEQRAAAGTVPSHLHQECVLLSAHTTELVDTYDDGGAFDDEALSTTPTFDTSTFSNLLHLDFNPDPLTLSITVASALDIPGYDYAIDVIDNKTQIAFMSNIESQKVVIQYRVASMVYSYGLSDIFGDAAQPSVMFQQVAGTLVTAFQQSRGLSSLSAAVLLEAAAIYAGGGNPLLALFYDEFPEYDGLAVDMPGAPYTASQARTIESADTLLLDIPVLVDHVDQPTVRLLGGTDFVVENGEIQAPTDLTASRGPTDKAPGVWWCPLVVLDERTLAKNFGFLAGDVRRSSAAYRDALRANYLLRYNGPTPAAVANAACAYLGSPFFLYDGIVTFVGTRASAWAVTAVSTDLSRQFSYELGVDETIPQAGDPVYVGQSVHAPAFEQPIYRLHQWLPDQMVVGDNVSEVAVGDTVYLLLTSPDGLVSWVPRVVSGFSANPSVLGSDYVITFNERTALNPAPGFAMRRFKPGSPPFFGFDGIVHSVKAIEQAIIQTTKELVVVPPGFTAPWNPGDKVFAAQPVFPNMVTVYDAVSRPNWHWLTPPVAGVQTRRSAVITAVPGDYSAATFNPKLPAVTPRTTVVITRPSDLREVTFTVIGSHLDTVYLKAPEDFTGSFSGQAVLTEPVVSDVFEFPAPKSSNGLPRSALGSAIRFGDSAILLSNPGQFSPKGRARIILPSSQGIEFDYDGIVSATLQRVKWDSDGAALGSDLLFPPGSYVLQVSVYADRRINPAFRSVAQALVVRDRNSQTNQPVINDSNVDTYFSLLSASSMVIETTAVQRPTPLRDLLSDTLPVGTTAVLLTKHKFEDRAAFAPSDVVTVHHQLLVTLSSPAGTITSGTLILPVNESSAVISASVVDPDGSGPFTYKWRLQALTGASQSLALSDSTIPRPLVSGMLPSGMYVLTLTVSNGANSSVTTALTISVTGPLSGDDTYSPTPP